MLFNPIAGKDQVSMESIEVRVIIEISEIIKTFITYSIDKVKKININNKIISFKTKTITKRKIKYSLKFLNKYFYLKIQYLYLGQ